MFSLVCNHLAEEEKAGCFILIAFLLCVAVSVMYLFLVVPLVSLRHVIVTVSVWRHTSKLWIIQWLFKLNSMCKHHVNKMS